MCLREGNKYHYGNHIKGDEMGGICNTHGLDEKYTQNFGRRVYSENVGVDGRIILEWI